MSDEVGHATADRLYADLLARLLDGGERLRMRNADVRRLFGLRLELASTPLAGLRRETEEEQ